MCVVWRERGEYLEREREREREREYGRGGVIARIFSPTH
jgi:hypothetical protein